MSTMISQSLLAEFDMETANTRKMLARVPDAAVAFGGGGPGKSKKRGSL